MLTDACATRCMTILINFLNQLLLMKRKHSYISCIYQKKMFPTDSQLETSSIVHMYWMFVILQISDQSRKNNGIRAFFTDKECKRAVNPKYTVFYKNRGGIL